MQLGVINWRIKYINRYPHLLLQLEMDQQLDPLSLSLSPPSSLYRSSRLSLSSLSALLVRRLCFFPLFVVK